MIMHSFGYPSYWGRVSSYRIWHVSGAHSVQEQSDRISSFPLLWNWGDSITSDDWKYHYTTSVYYWGQSLLPKKSRLVKLNRFQQQYYLFRYNSAQISLDADDFDSTTQHVFFFQDEDVSRVDCITVSIPIANDDVNEAQQDFVIQLSVVSLNVQDHGRISLSRNVSLARIIDDDRK